MLLILLIGLIYHGLRYAVKFYSLIPRQVDERKKGLWYNTIISLFNSILLGAASLYLLFIEPFRLMNLTAKETNNLARFIPLFCTGYFAYDVIDCALHLTLHRAGPIYIHHVLVVICYFVGMYLNYYNYITVSLLYEINTVFLHIRQLCHIAKVQPTNSFYRLNKIANIVTFLIFRICNFIWIIYFTLFLLDTRVESIAYWIGVAAMILLLLSNFYLLFQVLTSDCKKYANKKIVN